MTPLRHRVTALWLSFTQSSCCFSTHYHVFDVPLQPNQQLSNDHISCFSGVLHSFIMMVPGILPTQIGMSILLPGQAHFETLPAEQPDLYGRTHVTSDAKLQGLVSVADGTQSPGTLLVVVVRKSATFYCMIVLVFGCHECTAALMMLPFWSSAGVAPSLRVLIQLTCL